MWTLLGNIFFFWGGFKHTTEKLGSELRRKKTRNIMQKKKEKKERKEKKKPTKKGKPI